MNNKKILMFAGIGALAYYLFKKKNTMHTDSNKPGLFQRFSNKVAESVGKDLDEVASDIPNRPQMSKP